MNVPQPIILFVGEAMILILVLILGLFVLEPFLPPRHAIRLGLDPVLISIRNW
jgi:hypothetical protein